MSNFENSITLASSNDQSMCHTVVSVLHFSCFLSSPNHCRSNQNSQFDRYDAMYRSTPHNSKISPYSPQATYPLLGVSKCQQQQQVSLDVVHFPQRCTFLRITSPQQAQLPPKPLPRTPSLSRFVLFAQTFRYC